MDPIRNAAISRRGGVKIRGGRLPSLRSRDVIPGPSKTTIAPKIPQRRTIKTEQVDTAKTTSHGSDFTQRDRDRNRENTRGGRGRGRGARVYLQTEGTFLGSGPALRAIKKEVVDTSYYERGSGSRSKAKDSLQGTGFLLDNLDDEAFLDCSELLSPMRLPFVKSEVKTEDVIVKKENTEETIKIKEEPLDEDEVRNNWKDGGYFKSIKQENDAISDLDLKKVLFGRFQGKNPMMLIQMPSFLPFPVEDTNPGNSKSSNKNKDVKPSAACSAKDLPEGCIGKIQVMRSGKIRMVLNNVTFVLEQNPNRDDVQEVVSINTKEDPADLTVLGKIAKKVSLNPLMENMIEEDERVLL